MLKILGHYTMVNYLFLNKIKPVAEKAILNIAIIPNQFVLEKVGFVMEVVLNMFFGVKW